MTRHFQVAVSLAFLSLFLLAATTSLSGQDATTTTDAVRLQQDVAALNLSFSGYRLAQPLTAEQVAFGKTSRKAESYPGTYTVIDSDLSIVVEEKSEIVLALYQRFENAVQDKVKMLVTTLMTSFGEPTNIAHEKIIYWLYGAKGLMSQDEFDSSKDAAEGKIDIIASVKLSASRPIEEVDTPATLYWILSSNRLLQRFVAQAERGSR